MGGEYNGNGSDDEDNGKCMGGECNGNGMGVEDNGKGSGTEGSGNGNDGDDNDNCNFPHSITPIALAPFIVNSRSIQSMQCSSATITLMLMYRVGGWPGTVRHFSVRKYLQ